MIGGVRCTPDLLQFAGLNAAAWTQIYVVTLSDDIILK